VPRVKYTMNYRPKNSFSMSYASRKVIFPGESRSLTQIFQQNLLLASHGWWAYVCIFDPGQMVMMATVMMAMVMMTMVMMAMVMVSVMVVIVPEALRQVG